MTYQVLHLEDSDIDAEFVLDRLQRSGIAIQLTRVADRPGFEAQLRATPFDAILSDYEVPMFDGLAALEMAQTLQPDTPFLFVSGAMGEEFAVETLKRGATDYVLKQRLARLPAAIERAVREAKERGQRRAAQQAFREAEDRLRFAYEAARLGAWELDVETGVILCSRICKQNLGLPADAVVTERSLREQIHPDDREAVVRAIGAAIHANAEYDVEYRVVWPDGSIHWLNVRGRAMAYANGNATRMTGVSLDVTDRKLAEARLLEADRRKDEFLATLAHELRNPLAPIRNGLAMLRINPEDGQSLVGMMERQLAHMVRLIDDLLDISRINQNKMELRRGRVLLSEVISSALDTARPLIMSAGHELTVEIPPEGVVLDADLTRLAQVFSNLLGNSAKYTERGGHIRLHVEHVGGEIVAKVTDDGIGIPAESLPKVFDMFSQVDRSLERSSGGLGIGLALVKGIVEMHGGAILGESAGVGRGSTFTVRLPIVVPAKPAVASTNGNGHAKHKNAKRRILVVDDNLDSATSMSMMLKILGNEVATAYDGLQAVAEAEKFSPDLILMDLGMPRLNGYDATRRIREAIWGHDMKIVALTGWGQENDRRLSKEAGCDAHLVKPVSVDDLQHVLASLGNGNA